MNDDPDLRPVNVKTLYRIAAFMVDFGKDFGLHAVFLERTKALNYAASSHGVMRPLFERVEVSEPKDDT